MSRDEVKIRTGTIKSRYVLVINKITRERRYIKIKAKPRYGSIGSQSKDAGKEFW